MRLALLVGTMGLVACGGQTAELGGTGAGAEGGSGAGAEGGVGSMAVSRVPTTLVSEIQDTATALASDGTSLFWVSAVSAGPISSVPVGGGPTRVAVAGPVGSAFLAVDEVNIYYVGPSGALYRSAKGGGTPVLISEAGAIIEAVTVLGASVYWLERGTGQKAEDVLLKVAPLQGGATSTVTEFPFGAISTIALGVTTTTAFLSAPGGPSFYSFPIASGVPDGGMPTPTSGQSECSFLVSDTSTVYCSVSGDIVAIASNGESTTLGPQLVEGLSAGAGGLTFDDTYVYWVDEVTVGTIMKAPKTGGGATIVARDTSPIAIAVDANALYWSDIGGNIIRVAK